MKAANVCRMFASATAEYLLSSVELTCETGEIFLQVRGLYFVSQDVCLVEEEDDGGAVEPL